MQFEPFADADLDALHFRQSRAFQLASHRLTSRLLPPASRAAVFEHRVEVIHSDESEFFRMSIHNGFKHASGAADTAIRNHHRLSSNRVAHLVMINEKANRISFGFSVVCNANHRGAFIELVVRLVLESKGPRLLDCLLYTSP